MGSKEGKVQKEVISEQIKQLAKAKYIQKFSCLNLYDCANTWKKVVLYKDWSTLEEVKLIKCKIKGSQLLGIKDTIFAGLRILQISQNQLGHLGVKRIIKLWLPNLVEIRIDSSFIGTQGAIHLAKGRWKDLEFIQMQDNKISLDGYKQFSCLANCKNLELMWVGRYNKVRDEYESHPFEILNSINSKSNRVRVQTSYVNQVFSKDLKNMLDNRMIYIF